MKTQIIMILVVVAILALPGALYAQETDPAAVLIASYEAFNAGDIEADLDYFAEDAVVNIVPFGTYTGHDEIRGWIEKNAAVNGRMTWENPHVDGNTVTLKSTYTDDELQAIGITLEASETAIVKDGKIVEDTWVVTDESMAALMAAMPPEAMPETGGQTVLPYPLLLPLAGVALLGGLTFILWRCRSIAQ